MRQNLLISHDNILWLQAIVKILERPDLIEKTIEWSRMYGNVVHFREAPEPMNGYSHSKFHVEGKDFTNLNRRSLKKLRAIVADLVGVPEQFVIIAGVEPSSSFVVTLMMPDVYVNVLKKILQKTHEIVELYEIGVDTIAIGQDHFNVNGVTGGEVVASDQQMKFINVYKQLKTKSKLLEDREIECLQLSREIESMTVPNLTLQTFKNIFPNVPVTNDESVTQKQNPASLSSQSALVEFTQVLRQVTLNGYDRKVIERLLNANSSIVNCRVRDNYRIQIETMDIELQDLNSMLNPLLLELVKYKFYLQVDVQELEKSLLTMLQSIMAAITTTPATMEFMKSKVALMKKISGLLRNRDRQKLQKKYDWDPEDSVTQTLQQDSSLLLFCIFIKELTRAQCEIDVDQFVVNCLKEVNRNDLVKKYLDAVKKQQRSPVQKRDESPFPKRRPSEQQATSQQQAPNIDVTKLVDKVTEIDRKVTEIHETIQSTKKAFNTDYGSTKQMFKPTDPRSMYAPYSRRDTVPSK